MKANTPNDDRSLPVKSVPTGVEGRALISGGHDSPCRNCCGLFFISVLQKILFFFFLADETSRAISGRSGSNLISLTASATLSIGGML